MEKTQRKGLYVGGEEINKHLHILDAKEGDFIEVTQWDNLDGYTISLHTSLGTRVFELARDEFDLIKFMIDKLDYE